MVDVRRLPVEGADEVAVTLDVLAREGARRMIATAVEAEVAEYVERLAEEREEDGKRLVVRNGRARERRVTIGSGTVAIGALRVNDKRVDEETGERQRFSSKILPAYARWSPKVNDVLPVLYLRGLSTGDFRPALEQLLGEDAAGLSSSTISRLCKQWEAEHERFRTRSLRFHRYAYLFVDGVQVSVRLGEDHRLCLLLVIGVRENGTKELLAVEDSYRESTESWASVVRDLKARGLNEPRLVIGDGALGTWAALRDVFPAARRQACWVHKIANVLDALPKRLQPDAKKLLHEIMEAPSRADARAALERFREQFDAKYPKAVVKLDRDWAHLTDRVLRLPRRALARPAHLERDRVQLRDRQAAHARDEGRRLEEGPRWPNKLLTAAQERWRRFNGHELVADVLDGANLGRQIAFSAARMNESRTAFSRGDCAGAVDSALGSIDALAVRADPYVILGYCDVRLGLPDLAVRAMDSAVAHDPDNWETHYGRALVLGAAGRDPRRAARRALELHPLEPMVREAVDAFSTKDPQTWRRRALEARLPVEWPAGKLSVWTTEWCASANSMTPASRTGPKSALRIASTR